jgi:predicted amidohydrolase YtcJ
MTRTLITHANVYTANPLQPHAEAVVVDNQTGRILFVGSNAEAEVYRTPECQVVHGRGQTLLPGFNDSHFHLLWGAIGLGEIDLSPVRSLPELKKTIYSALSGTPDNQGWVIARGLRYNIPSPTTPLTRHHLDSIISHRPFIITAYDYHTLWANSTALQLAGLLHGGQSGPNSQIVMGADGLATGELREPGAYNQLLEHQPPHTHAQKRELLRRAGQLCASLGITSVQNMDGNLEQAQLYAEMMAADELPLRVYLPYDVTPETPFSALATEAVTLQKAFPRTQPNALLRTGMVKFFMDGVLESYTAALTTPYADQPDTHGDFLFTAPHFQQMAIEADRLGLQIGVHCCGDAAVRRTLDGYEAVLRHNGRRDSRHRIEHIELIHPADVTRFAQLGVLASMQPLHAPLLHLDDSDVWPLRAGKARWGDSFAWQTLRHAGAIMPFGSDWPVVTPNPMLGIFATQNRQAWGDEGEGHFRLPLTAVLDSYTRHAAYAEFQEAHKGQLCPGYLADMVLLSTDIFTLPPEELAEVTAVWTMCHGRVVHDCL